MSHQTQNFHHVVLLIWRTPGFLECMRLILSWLGSSYYHGQVDQKFKFFHTFFLCYFVVDFVGIIVIQSLQHFHCSYYFCIDSGPGGCFYLFVDIFIKKDFFILAFGFRITNYRIVIIVILINYMNHFKFRIIIWPLITCRNQEWFFNLTPIPV